METNRFIYSKDWMFVGDEKIIADIGTGLQMRMTEFKES